MLPRWNHTIDDRNRDDHGHRGPVSVWNMSAARARTASSFFPFFAMGQYFKAANLDKKEVVCPWCIGGGAKLWEWAANPQGAIFTVLLRQSSAGGGGDYYGYRTQEVHLGQYPKGTASEAMMHKLGAVLSMEGRPVCAPPASIVGRWAGDRVVLVGDYDESNLWEQLPSYRNISADLVDAWNNFIELDEMKLAFRPECCCREDS
jgi:hypothetical protein